jgi:hypothetical protein
MASDFTESHVLPKYLSLPSILYELRSVRAHHELKLQERAAIKRKSVERDAQSMQLRAEVSTCLFTIRERKEMEKRKNYFVAQA